MAARRLPSILPPLGAGEAIEAARVASACGRPVEPAIAGRRPFRAPHHTISTAGLIGGGNPPRPGEVTLAHRGVLFLDELPEFGRDTLEALRQPLEEGCVRIARARYAVELPSTVSARRGGESVSLRPRAALGRLHLRPGLGPRPTRRSSPGRSPTASTSRSPSSSRT